MNRRRLELEAMRDCDARRLRTAGRDDRRPGRRDLAAAFLRTGAPSTASSTARTCRGCSGRFDLASPDATNPQRHETTVPQQALFMMNSPFVIEQARRVAARPDVAAIADPARRIRYLYRLFFGRLPTAEEIAMGLSFVAVAGSAAQLPVRSGSQVALAAASSRERGSRIALRRQPRRRSRPSPWEEYHSASC